jgi:hypothetical protein
MAAYHRVIMRYFARPSTVPVILFWPEQEAWGDADAAATAWRPIAPVVAVHVVRGDHLSALHEHLDTLAAPLASHLAHEPAPPATTAARRPLLDACAFVAHGTEVLLEHAVELAPCLV